VKPVRCSYGNTVYRCNECGFDAWGAAVNYHELSTGHTSTEIGFHAFDRSTQTWHWRTMDGKRAEYPAHVLVGVQ